MPLEEGGRVNSFSDRCYNKAWLRGAVSSLPEREELLMRAPAVVWLKFHIGEQGGICSSLMSNCQFSIELHLFGSFMATLLFFLYLSAIQLQWVKFIIIIIGRSRRRRRPVKELLRSGQSWIIVARRNIWFLSFSCLLNFIFYQETSWLRFGKDCSELVKRLQSFSSLPPTRNSLWSVRRNGESGDDMFVVHNHLCVISYNKTPLWLCSFSCCGPFCAI